MTKNKFSAFIAIVLLCIAFSNGQQTPSFAEYNYNPFIVNSAYAGMSASTEIILSNSGFANQLEGSPTTFNLSFNSPLNRGKVGVGAGIVSDKIGDESTTNIFAAYSYKIFFDFKDSRPYWQHYHPGVLSFGLTAGVQQYNNNLTATGLINDPEFSQNINATIPNIGVGFLFNHSRFYIGLSTPNVLGTRFASNDDLKLNTPYYGYAGYRFFTNRFEEIMIKPSAFLKYEKGSPAQLDMNLTVSYKNRFEIGGGYRTSSSVNLLAGIYLFNNLRVIYQYNMALTENPFGNTHGFILSYQFGDGYAN